MTKAPVPSEIKVKKQHKDANFHLHNDCRPTVDGQFEHLMPSNWCVKPVYGIQKFQLTATRAPRGTDRSPEYKEHFCYKLDSRVKNVTTEWNR